MLHQDPTPRLPRSILLVEQQQLSDCDMSATVCVDDASTPSTTSITMAHSSFRSDPASRSSMKKRGRSRSRGRHGVHFDDSFEVLVYNQQLSDDNVGDLWFANDEYNAMYCRAQEASKFYNNRNNSKKNTRSSSSSSNNSNNNSNNSNSNSNKKNKTRSRQSGKLKRISVFLGKNRDARHDQEHECPYDHDADDDCRGAEDLAGMGYLQRRRWIRFSRLAVMMVQSQQEKRLHRDEDGLEIAQAYRKESAPSARAATLRGIRYANVASTLDATTSDKGSTVDMKKQDDDTVSTELDASVSSSTSSRRRRWMMPAQRKGNRES